MLARIFDVIQKQKITDKHFFKSSEILCALVVQRLNFAQIIFLYYLQYFLEIYFYII